MAQLIIEPNHLQQLSALEKEVSALNSQRINLIFEIIGIKMSKAEFEKLLDWPLIQITAPDRAMAIQLNKLAAYIPNLKFVTDATLPLFSIAQGQKVKRVWKERQG